MALAQEVAKVMVATIELEMLHPRTGHEGSVALRRLGRDDLVCGLEGGVVRELGVYRNCERPRLVNM